MKLRMAEKRGMEVGGSTKCDRGRDECLSESRGRHICHRNGTADLRRKHPAHLPAPVSDLHAAPGCQVGAVRRQDGAVGGGDPQAQQVARLGGVSEVLSARGGRAEGEGRGWDCGPAAVLGGWWDACKGSVGYYMLFEGAGEVNKGLITNETMKE